MFVAPACKSVGACSHQSPSDGTQVKVQKVKKKKVFKKRAICTSGLIGSEHPSVGSFPCAARICGVFKAGGKCLFKKAGKGKCMCVCLCDAIVCTLQFSINAFFILQKLEGIDVTVGTTESDEL